MAHQVGAYSLLLQRPVAHGAVAGQPGGRRIFVLIGVQIAVQVDAHHVPGVTQLPAGGVGGVVRVDEFVLIDHGARGGAAACVGVAVGFGAGRVHVRQIAFDGLRDAERPAECAYHARLGDGVLLLGRGLPYYVGHPAAHRPGTHVAPVPVLRQHRIRLQQRPVLIFEHLLAVAGAAGPVHQPVGRVGSVVEFVDAQIGGHPTAYGGVLVRGYVPGQWNHQPQPGGLWRVLVG